MTITQLLVDSAKPSFRPKPVGRLVTVLLQEYRFELGRILANALLEALPPEMGAHILDPLQRLGNRLAYQAVRFGCPDRQLSSRRDELMKRLSRLINYLEYELRERRAVAHLEVVKIYRERLFAYLQLANALATLSDKEELGPALQTCLVEGALIAGISEVNLTGQLAQSVLHEADAASWDRLFMRMEAGIRLGMANPREPEFSEIETQHGVDLLWESLTSAGPGSLTILLGRLQGNMLGRPLVKADDEPYFLGALVKHEGFMRAGIRVPAALRDASPYN